MKQPHPYGRVFVISSPSGGGKTTVIRRLSRSTAFVRSISVTTRPRRPGEKNGQDYRFLTQGAFDRLRRQKGLLEWARVHGAYYGTPKQPVLKTLARGRNIILSIDVQGARTIRRALKDQAVLIFLLPPSMRRLKQRLLQRKTETNESLKRRLKAAYREIACAKWYDYVIINDRLGQTVSRVRAILRSTQQSQSRKPRRRKAQAKSGA